VRERIVVPSLQAVQDLEETAGYYLESGGDKVFEGFLAEVEKAFRHIARFPASGSDRFAQEFALPGLRSWRMARFPYFVFYVAKGGQVDVWRLLHAQRDIPSLLRDPGF